MISSYAKKHHRKLKPKPAPSPNNSNYYDSKTFNVMDYGAKGDGKTDDTNAFKNAWLDACKAGNSEVLVPADYTFLLGPLDLSVQCNNIIFQLNGNLLASTSSSAWKGNLLQWLNFRYVTDLRIQGTGRIDGQGLAWWNKKNGFSTAPTALRVADVKGSTVVGISFVNSAKAHLKFDNCDGVLVDTISIQSPGESPNTDGIHLQNSVNVEIRESKISSGDDCISIQTGCENVFIDRVACGPSHGISIGGLGKNGEKATVSGVIVQDSTITSSMTGTRIKTWQGGSGAVSNVSFTNIRVSKVDTPIVIDQYYSDEGHTQNKTSAVAVTDISFVKIQGTYNQKAVSIACSDNSPCKGVTLSNIGLNSASLETESPLCYRAYVSVEDPVSPSINCKG
ncbi:Pectin lyase-like superfamily protein [Striga hermonthica]|uniref:Pectin lyase-like superfamily protein n=1 Tax=Striga hermonthica TaxID=68872 RepID=A0A9N7R8C5_STRHE|nr:Pectin lyase-like superfamily protein [Striga hermonthica]